MLQKEEIVPEPESNREKKMGWSRDKWCEAVDEKNMSAKNPHQEGTAPGRSLHLLPAFLLDLPFVLLQYLLLWHCVHFSVRPCSFSLSFFLPHHLVTFFFPPPLSADFTFHQEIYIHRCFSRVYWFYPSYRSAPQRRTCGKIVNRMNCVQRRHLCRWDRIKCEIHLIFYAGDTPDRPHSQVLKYWCFVTPLDVSYRRQRLFRATVVPDLQLTRCKLIHSIYYTLRVIRWGSLKIHKAHVCHRSWKWCPEKTHSSVTQTVATLFGSLFGS